MSKVTEAIRKLRDQEGYTWPQLRLAIASALEELDERTRGEAGGEAPEPLPEVLPVGTRATGGDGTRWVAESEVTWDDPNAKRYTGMWRADDEYDYSECGIDQRCIDWAHYRRTHSPPPSREGEAAEVERIHRAIGERGPHDRMADCVIEWIVDAKEAFREKDEENARLAAELEAARARVGVLHEAIIRALNVMAPNDLAGARLQDALDAMGFVREDEEGPDEQRKDPLQAKEAMVASVPAAAETEPGVLRPPVHGAGEVAPPGLTPEEAGAGARLAYLKARVTRPFLNAWFDLSDNMRAALVVVHSEGAAEAGKRVAERVQPMRDTLWSIRNELTAGVTPWPKIEELDAALEALAAELEGAK